MSDLEGTRAAAKHLDLSEDTVRAHAKAGIIPAIKIGSRWRFDLEQVDAYLKAPADPWAQSAQSRGRRRAT